MERRWVDGIARALLSPLLASNAELDGWRVLGWDAEQGICLTLAKGPRTLLIELERLDLGRECYARTKRFNACARRSNIAARAPLDDDDRRVIERVLDVVRRRERHLPVLDRAPAARVSIVRNVEVGHVLVPEGLGQYYVNPYVGCTIGCEWCYVAARADFSRELEGLPRIAWGRWVDVKQNAAEVLAREVQAHPPGIVRLSPIVTDPYQPIERRFRVTRQCLEVLLGAEYRPCILTRATRVLEDLPLLTRFSRAAVGFSIPTDDDSVRRRFEPGADPIDERIAALRRLRDVGLTTFAVVQPVLPGDPERLAELVAPLVDVVRVDRMYGFDDPRLDADQARACERVAAAFLARGVRHDELDDLHTLFDGDASCNARI